MDRCLAQLDEDVLNETAGEDQADYAEADRKPGSGLSSPSAEDVADASLSIIRSPAAPQRVRDLEA